MRFFSAALRALLGKTIDLHLLRAEELQPKRIDKRSTFSRFSGERYLAARM